MVQTQALNRRSGGSCCHLRLCFLINFVHTWPLPGTECFYAVRIFYCEIKWQRLSYPKTRLFLILPRPDGEMEPPSQPSRVCWVLVKYTCRRGRPCVVSEAGPAWGMSRWAIHRSQRSSLSRLCAWGQKANAGSHAFLRTERSPIQASGSQG